jgi:DNA-binding transcriptional LysR family regulator
MNIQQVRYFLAICRERNFTRAAKACKVSQPSLSGCIRRLEGEIGGRLFVRNNPVTLTGLGAEVAPLLSQMLDAAERVLNAGPKGKQSVRTRRRHVSKFEPRHIGEP